MDGFAEMTVQETALLAAILPWCGKATLAFCCEANAIERRNHDAPSGSKEMEPPHVGSYGVQRDSPAFRFSPWSVVAHTATRCLNAVSEIAEGEVVPLRRRCWSNVERRRSTSRGPSPSARRQQEFD